MSATMVGRDVIEIRKIGLRALNAALGEADAKVFLQHWRGEGDFTKERHERPEPANEDIFAGIMKLQEADDARVQCSNP